MIGLKCGRIEIICLDQCAHAIIFGPTQPFQSFLYQDPILSVEIHHIPYSRNPDKFQVFSCFLQNAKAAVKLAYNFPCHRCAAQLFIGIGAEWLLGIDDLISRRKQIRSLIQLRSDTYGMFFSGFFSLPAKSGSW